MSKKVWSVHNEHKYFWYHYNYDNYNDRDTMLAIIDLQISEILSLLDIDGDQQWQQQQQPKRSHFGYGSTQPRLMVIAYQPPSWNEEIFEEYGHVKEAIKEYIPNILHKTHYTYLLPAPGIPTSYNDLFVYYFHKRIQILKVRCIVVRGDSLYRYLTYNKISNDKDKCVVHIVSVKHNVPRQIRYDMNCRFYRNVRNIRSIMRRISEEDTFAMKYNDDDNNNKKRSLEECYSHEDE